MKCTVVGTKEVSYVSKKTGKPINGISLFIEREPNDRDQGVRGLIADNIFISAETSCFKNLPDFEFGKEYDFHYDFDGRFSFLSEVVDCGA